MIIALAGRRIDAEGSVHRFSLAQLAAVRDQLTQLFDKSRPQLLVCSAASGADLLALEVAISRNIPCRVILPFDKSRFRETSVTDRPGDWGPLFDRICAKVEGEGRLTTLNFSPGFPEAYEGTSQRILDEAQAAESAHKPLAVCVWDGEPKDSVDHTLLFGKEAQRRGWEASEVFTSLTGEPARGVGAKLARQGPRRLLALDGGGIRGLISIEVLAAIEAILRNRAGNPNLVLADYFDYIAGTSTGAILGAALCLGWPVERLRQFYVTSGARMFHPSRLLERIKSKYNDDALTKELKQEFGIDSTGRAKAILLGDNALLTLLMVVLRNATTDSPWPVSNNPQARYNVITHPACNLNIPLWQVVRASTAAPTYFPPEVVQCGHKSFVFVDGGVTPYNCPAFQLFLMATVQPYNLSWKATEDQMLLVSVGTGTASAANPALRPSQMHLLFNASTIPAALMNAALQEQDFLCRVFGRCLVGGHLDNEVGNMIGQNGPVTPKLFTYARYDCDLSADGLCQLEIDPRVKPKDVQSLDAVDQMESLSAIGKALADHIVRGSHFFGFGR